LSNRPDRGAASSRLSIVCLAVSVVSATAAASAYAQGPARRSAVDVAVGLSYLELQGEEGYHTDYGGFGLGAAVSGGVTRPNSETRSRTAWVADFSWHHHTYSGAGLEIGTKTFSLVGGVRHQRAATAKVDWFAQALAGIVGGSYSTSRPGGSHRSRSSFIPNVMPGFGFDYVRGERTSVRAQLDFSLSYGGIAPRLFLGLVRKL
jgi:hypothetical protein